MQSSSPLYSTCEEDENGDLLIEIPESILEKMGWKENTELEISHSDGNILLRESKESGD
jgi:antitoxin component of MazEF toxin-antitoxin module